MSFECFLHSLNQIDFIGREPKLKINGQPRNQSIIGGILCILIYCIFILCALYFGQELVYRVLPKIIETTQKVEENDQILLGKNQFMFFYSIFDEEQNFSPPNLFINSELNIVYVDNNLNQNEKTINKRPLKLKPCDYNDFAERTDDSSYKALNLSQWMCVETGNDKYSIKSNDNYNHFSYLELKITECKNSECLPKDIIQKKLEKAILFLKYYDFQYNQREFDKYYRDMIFGHKIAFDSYIKKSLVFNLQITSFKTDIGYMFEDFKEKSFHNVQSISNLFRYKQNPEMMHEIDIYFQMGISKSVNYRKYYKFQNWVAELGGIVRALTLVATVLNYFNDKSSYYQLMINKLFDVDDVIKYFQYSDISNGKKKKRDSIILCNAKKEKDYFEKGIFQNITEKRNPNSVSPSHKCLSNNFVSKTTLKKAKSSLNREKESNLGKNTSNINNTNNGLISENNPPIIGDSGMSSDNSEADPHELYIENLKNNLSIKEHFEKVKKKRFSLNMFEAFIYCFSSKKDNPKYNAFYGGRELIIERSDIIYLLKKNLELERFKNLILRDNQLLLLNSLTKFMLDPERVNLLDFEKCSYDKFIDFYDHICSNTNVIDIKLSKWVETKYKIDHINHLNIL